MDFEFLKWTLKIDMNHGELFYTWKINLQVLSGGQSTCKYYIVFKITISVWYCNLTYLSEANTDI